MLSVLFNNYRGKLSVRDRDRFTSEPSGRLESDSCDRQKTDDREQKQKSKLACSWLNDTRTALSLSLMGHQLIIGDSEFSINEFKPTNQPHTHAFIHTHK